ncbi:hypothetical protein HDU67_009739, partial [Dinochytrium kinnereticum]
MPSCASDDPLTAEDDEASVVGGGGVLSTDDAQPSLSVGDPAPITSKPSSLPFQMIVLGILAFLLAFTHRFACLLFASAVTTIRDALASIFPPWITQVSHMKKKKSKDKPVPVAVMDRGVDTGVSSTGVLEPPHSALMESPITPAGTHGLDCQPFWASMDSTTTREIVVTPPTYFSKLAMDRLIVGLFTPLLVALFGCLVFLFE